MSPPEHIKSPKDLVTTHSAICAGFLAQAVAKTEKANPYVKAAIVFWRALRRVRVPRELIDAKELRDDLLAAAGFSEKAKEHLSDKELQDALRTVLSRFAGRKAGWREQVFCMYLLTKGDSLGGSMRNLTGAIAGKRVAESAVRQLTALGHTTKLEYTNQDKEKVESISWDERSLVFDKKIPFIGNNVDVILLQRERKEALCKEMTADKSRYRACGELKGGIDPAGADEHWKTASTALQRIRESFDPKVRPRLFYLGAAIEQSMAMEIVEQLNDGRLDYAGNLTRPEQVHDLIAWLTSL